MEGLTDAWLKVGVGGFLLILVAYAILWHIVPHWKAKDLKEQEFKHRQAERIQDREDGILKEIAGYIQQNIAESKALSARVDTVTDLVREEFRERRRG
jgi:hypothetical protein